MIQMKKIIVLSFTMLCVVSGCIRIEGKKLYAPMTEEQVSALAVPGISKEELLAQCGKPFRTRIEGNVEDMEFLLSMDNVRATNDWVMASFIVTVSNNAVVSWKPNSKGRVR